MSLLSKASLIFAGFYSFAFAVFHLLFWKIFKWKVDLKRISSANRNIMQILNLCLTFLFIVMGTISLAFPREIAATALGRTLVASFALFWLLRAFEQVLFFGLKHRISVALTVIFFIGAAAYLVPAVLALGA